MQAPNRSFPSMIEVLTQPQCSLALFLFSFSDDVARYKVTTTSRLPLPFPRLLVVYPLQLPLHFKGIRCLDM